LAATLDVSDCELLPLRSALGHWRKAARARLLKGGQAVEPRPMLWPCAVEDIQDAHTRPSAAPDADLIVINNAVVGGAGSMAFKDGGYLYARSAYPGYIQAYIEREVAPQTWAFDRRALKTWRIRRAFVLAHFNMMWGHWLTEVFPKLFAIKLLRDRGLEAPILLPDAAPSYVQAVIEDLIPGQEVIVYPHATHCVWLARALLPPMLQSFYVAHPWFGAALDAYTAEVGRGADKRVFVSRAGMRTSYAYRELVNEAELEAVAAERGFRIVSPEALSWREQIALFAGAEVVTGEFGSGLHNALFSPAGTKVVALNCIGDIQSRIANFRRQDIGYVLPDDGEARVFHPDRPVQRYRIDPKEFGSRLDLATQAAGSAQ
jgi:O-antigen biosynthesis protein WbqL